MAEADFARVIDCFKVKNNATVNDLYASFQQGTLTDEDVPNNSSIRYPDAIFQFIYCILENNSFKQNFYQTYYKFRKSENQGNVGQNARNGIVGKNGSLKVFSGDWTYYFNKNYPTPVPGTPLKPILTCILDFLTAYRITTASDFIDFLTKRCGVSAKELPEKKGSAKIIIRKAIENTTNETSGKKCVIFTGAPGTGKTYCVEEFVRKEMKGTQFEMKENEYFVQFHSSYDYTDFMEGLRPIQDENGKMIFVCMDGIFKAFCREVVRLNQVEQEKKNGSQNAQISQTDKQKKDGAEEAPAKTDEGVNGEKMYYFVIDEINRADLGRVFGELMYCFEKRGKKIATQYTNLPAYGKDGKEIENDCFKNGGFYIPKNVVIIGTMNDIDRSVETFDFALRRRFDWVELKADAVMETSLIDMGVHPDVVHQIIHNISAMNDKIKHQSGLGEEFKIGPAYFKDLKNYDVSKSPKDNLEPIWKHNIEPILREYVRGRQGADKFVPECETALLSAGKGGNNSDSQDGTAGQPEPQPSDNPSTAPAG